MGGFTSSAIDVFDITNPLLPAHVTGGSITPVGPQYQVAFEQTGAPRRYLALAATRWTAPAIVLDAPSSLRSPANGADYIVISHADFLQAVQPLADDRAGQGMRVRVVDVQDVYDEFSEGLFDPQAIHSFLAYAYSNWASPAPAYVLLVGDGHYDFKDYYKGSGANYMPPFLGEYDPWIGETASDNSFVTVSGGDILPDMYIGRLPATSAAETTAMVSKILAYEQQPLQGDWNTRLAFVADNADSGGNFPTLSNAIADHLRSDLVADKIYYGITHTNPAAARTAVLNAINQGRLMVTYTGHASTQFWADEYLFQVSSVGSLTNTGMYPFFVSLTCQDGYFIFPQGTTVNIPSLSESLLRPADRGSIASFSSTGFGQASGHDILAQGLYRALFDDGATRLGQATTAAKLHLFSSSTGFRDLIDTYMLFGDPATQLKVTPTAVMLSSFTASATPDGIRLDWSTANEIGALGFNLYRAETSDALPASRVKLNTGGLIEAKGLPMGGADYSRIYPAQAGKPYFYWLETVRSDGSDTSGPMMAVARYWYSAPAMFRRP